MRPDAALLSTTNLAHDSNHVRALSSTNVGKWVGGLLVHMLAFAVLLGLWVQGQPCNRRFMSFSWMMGGGASTPVCAMITVISVTGVSMGSALMHTFCATFVKAFNYQVHATINKNEVDLSKMTSSTIHSAVPLVQFQRCTPEFAVLLCDATVVLVFLQSVSLICVVLFPAYSYRCAGDAWAPVNENTNFAHNVNHTWLPWHSPTVAIWILSVQTCNILVWYLLSWYVDSMRILLRAAGDNERRRGKLILGRLQTGCNLLHIFCFPIALSVVWILFAEVALDNQAPNGTTESNIGFWECVGVITQFFTVAMCAFVTTQADVQSVELQKMST